MHFKNFTSPNDLLDHDNLENLTKESSKAKLDSNLDKKEQEKMEKTLYEPSD